jgi:3-phosphoshikimate 1-carboxyvinyltransferase
MRIAGVNSQFPNLGSLAEPIDCFVGNSGLTIRTLLPALVASMSLQAGRGLQVDGCVVLRGVARMHERPIGDLVDGLRAVGAQIDYLGEPGYPPLRVRSAVLPAAEVLKLRASTSSQFLTGLLQAAPVLGCQRGMPVRIVVEGAMISRPYIDLSIGMLADFGVQVDEPHPGTFVIPPARLGAQPLWSASGLSAPSDIHKPTAPTAFVSPGTLAVEGDASSASYFLGAGLLGGGPLRVCGVGQKSRQGDIHFADALVGMGAEVVWGDDFIEVRAGRRSPEGLPVIQGIDLDCNAIPDAAMTLVPIALYAQGPSRLRNIGSWRVKETDRIAAMAAEARKFGASVEEGPDFLVVHPPSRLQTAAVHTYDDHRVAMSFSLTSFQHSGDLPPMPPPATAASWGTPPLPTATATVTAQARTVTILDPNCVAKTFPDYFDVFAEVAAQAVPVIAIDGPTASGKGTVAAQVAEALGFFYLDSGALYRLLALKSLSEGIDPRDEAVLAGLAQGLDIAFSGTQIYMDGTEVTEAIRAEVVGNRASEIAALPQVRRALLRRQRDFARGPGLVADGRDMGSVVFPQATTKIFLTASVQARAERRFKQLIDKGIPAKLESLLADLQARDHRDSSRSVAPLRFVEGSGVVYLDTTSMTIPQAVEAILRAYRSSVSA